VQEKMVLKYSLRKTLAEYNFACSEEAEIDKLYNTGKKGMSKISLNSDKIRRVLVVAETIVWICRVGLVHRLFNLFSFT